MRHLALAKAMNDQLSLFVKPKLSRQQSRILARLRQGPATSVDLNAICYRFGGRICELRELGYDIETLPIKGQSIKRYELKG